MRYLFILLLLVSFTAGTHHAYGRKHKYRSLPRTEVGLMNNVLGCLMNKDSLNYFYLFPPFDSLWAMVIHNPDHTPETMRALNELKEHPQSLLQFDPFYNRNILNRFSAVLQKGEDSGIHWNSIVMQRYELKKEPPSRDLIGYDKIAPERFKGYMFIRDLLGRLTFCITITEIQKIQGYFFGGQVINILEASTIDEYIFKENEERKYFEWLSKNQFSDSLKTDSLNRSLVDTAHLDSAAKKRRNLQVVNTTEDEKQHTRKLVTDRKYYEGKFDDEIPVKLFIRYLKDVKSGKSVLFDGLYKFGDQANYVKLNITKDAEGKWIMEDDPPVGSLELELVNKVFTGQWTNNENGTGYDVVLKQADITEKKLEQLDLMLETGMYGRADQAVFDKVKTDEKNKEEKSPRIERLERKIKRQKEREEREKKEREEEVENAKKEMAKQLGKPYEPPKEKPKEQLKEKPKQKDDEGE